MRDEIWYLVGLGQDQDNLQTLLRQHIQQFLQLVTRLGIETDKRVLHDQHLGISEERCCQLEFPQLSTREQDDIFIEKRLQVEYLVDMLLQGSPLRCVIASQLIGLFKFAAYGGSLLVDLHLIPALLQEVSPVVVTSVGITECDVLQIVIWLIETVSHHTWVGRMTASQHIHEHGFPRAITPDDGDVLTFFEGEVHWLSHRPLRLPRARVPYFYCAHL